MKKYRVNGLLWILVAALGVALFPSCRSHKKIQKQEPYIEETVEVKHHKKGPTIGERIAEESLSWIGTPYGFGKCEKGVATDCSGMVIIIYEQIAEIKLPRNSAEQADFCEDLEEGEIEPGDLVFFATGKDKKKVSHVGIMVDREQFVHASGSKGVMLSDMTTPYYRRTFIKYGRVLSAECQEPSAKASTTKH